MPVIGRVKRPPKGTPLMIYDGECLFCCRWIERWKRITKDAVQYKPYQDLKGSFPEISVEEYKQAVCLIDTEGNVSSGAQAVFQTLAYEPKRKWLLRLYQRSRLFQGITEGLYALVAKNRVFFSSLEKAFGFVGKHRSYQLTQWVFFRALGLVYLVAFISIGSQILGLVGSQGILPIAEILESAEQRLGGERYWFFPTLSWLGASDAFLMAQCFLGVIAALLVMCGVLTGLGVILCWVLYLSISVTCGVFFNFQWDALLLEAGFLACFFVPFQWVHRIHPEEEPSRLMIWLFRWLLFRLMFASGAVKLLSGDPTWWDLTALTHHYETQPLPTWIAWYAHQLPVLFHQLSIVGIFFIEMGVSFLIFTTRRLRLFACGAFCFVMVVIAVTGNYCFFNILTVVLCILLLDDDVWPRRWKSWLVQKTARGRTLWRAGFGRVVVAAIAVVVISVTIVNFGTQMRWKVDWPKPILQLRTALSPLRIFNRYGLFAVMTTSRPEIIVEGSRDGKTWKAYEFNYKPGDLTRRPRFNLPHQPRLDWQMWFAALGNYRHNPWLILFCQRLLEGSPSVLGLLEDNPFPDNPPSYIRAVLYDYEFSTPEERRKTGQWWVRHRRRAYTPVLTLKDEKGA